MDRLVALQEPEASESSSMSDSDKDLALARLLQEQENAFMFLGGSSASHSARASTGAGSEEDEDVALARALQAEEQQELQQRMLAMAGLAAGGEAGGEYEEEGTDPAQMSYEQLGALGDIAGHVSKGLAPGVVDGAAPRRSFRDLKAASGSGAGGEALYGQDMCAICRLDFEDADECRLLPSCRHCYHADCIEQWLGLNKVCPVCNTEVAAGASSAAPELGLAAQPIA